MTQNIEQRTEVAVTKYEKASGVVDLLANTDSTVQTAVGPRDSFPKLSREFAEDNFRRDEEFHSDQHRRENEHINAQSHRNSEFHSDQLRRENEHINDQSHRQVEFQERFSVSQQTIDWLALTNVHDAFQRYSIGVKGQADYKEYLPNPDKLPFITGSSIDDDLSNGYWLENGVPSKGFVESRIYEVSPKPWVPGNKTEAYQVYSYQSPNGLPIEVYDPQGDNIMGDKPDEKFHEKNFAWIDFSGSYINNRNSVFLLVNGLVEEFKIAGVDGALKNYSGVISNINIQTFPYSATIGLENVYILDKEFFKLSSTYMHIKAFHSKCDDSDDTDIIEAWLDFCFLSGKIPFSDGKHKTKKPIVHSGLAGVKGYTKFTFDEGFVNQITADEDDRKYFCVYNRQYSKIFNENTAGTFKVHGVHFHVEMVLSEAKINAIFGTANTTGCEFFDNKFTSNNNVTPETGGARTCMSFYDANKHMKLHHNEMYNNTKTNGGGCLWVQGGSGSESQPEQATEDIQVYQNDFYQERSDDGDEAVAIWASGGILKNVKGWRNNFYLKGGGQGLTVFNSASAATTFGIIQDVKWNHNNFYTDLHFNVVRVGGQYLSDDITEVDVSDNEFWVKTNNETSSYVIRTVQTGSKITYRRNKIRNIGDVKFSRGIAGYDFINKTIAESNTIEGRFASALSRCWSASDNTIIKADIALDDCVLCADNEFDYIYTYLARFTGGEKYVFTSNYGSTAPGAVAAVYSTNACSGDVTISNNPNIQTSGTTRSILAQGTGKRRSYGNVFTGSGEQPAGNFQMNAMNDYYGTIV
ncbi:hypothetical protein VCRA2125O79_330042 [Vibrio crassostreae]|nr:hypothetical protein VCRA2120O63_350002 [Vibrio crassostreae]CAK3506829.1 hypothetical protein VCRA2125O79_330042 [Vibrio crassostreae]CAK3527355.1 hypothetical protein VCRA2122O72_300034 [Vibrio crassostreae]